MVQKPKPIYSSLCIGVLVTALLFHVSPFPFVRDVIDPDDRAVANEVHEAWTDLDFGLSVLSPVGIQGIPGCMAFFAGLVVIAKLPGLVLDRVVNPLRLAVLQIKQVQSILITEYGLNRVEDIRLVSCRWHVFRTSGRDSLVVRDRHLQRQPGVVAARSFGTLLDNGRQNTSRCEAPRRSYTWLYPFGFCESCTRTRQRPRSWIPIILGL